MLIMPVLPVVAVAPPTVTFRDNEVFGSSSSKTISGVPLGSAAENRLVVVAYGHRSSGSVTTASCSFGGVTPTNHGAYSDFGSVTLLSAVVPTGTSGDITVVTSSSQAGSISVWTIHDLASTTIYDVGGGTDANETSLSVSGLNVSAGGVVIAASQCNDNNGLSFSWEITVDSMTERFDVNVPSGNPRFGGADAVISTSGTRTVTMNMNTSVNDMTIIAGSWR